MMTETEAGALVRKKRKALDLTQETLARRIGCHRTFIVMIEKGQARPGLDYAVALGRELEIDPAIFARDRTTAGDNGEPVPA